MRGASPATGYSGSPQWKKLGLRDAARVALVGAPGGWALTPDDDFPAIELVADGGADVVVAFAREQASVVDLIETQRERIKPAGALWIAWPRKAAGHASDVTDETVRAVALEVGLVDVKVAALDSDWSSLKLVWRRRNR
ncbi:DUF3052 family protein [Gryllotalpicola protaetiae]|uniref:DUF3052 family protein n=1 Tax=Gryllotalpicola protaetiae TaxID=2419771 RepID=UPI001C6603DC|nr:DUF3052 family protein [Gryllotalpicola protaetiae]